MLNIDAGRDEGAYFWSDSSVPAAGATVRSPWFLCEDPPGVTGYFSAGLTQSVVPVRGPGIDVFIILPTASAGATLTIAGGTGPGGTVTIFTAPAVAAAGSYQMAALLASAYGATAPPTLNSPCAAWQVAFNNGASDQASAITFFVRAGGKN